MNFNLKRMIKNDGYIKMFIIYGIVSVILGVLFTIQYQEVSWNMLFFGMTLVVAVLFYLRYYAIKNFDLDSTKVKATIKNTLYYRGSRIVTYEYDYQGITYRKRTMITTNKETRNLKMDDEVEILVKNQDPKKSIIWELYFDTEL